MRIALLLPFALPLLTHGQSWTPQEAFPGPVRDDASAFELNGDIYVGTGMDGGFQLTTDWYRFSTWSLTWTPVTAMPTTGRQYTTAFSLGGRGYVQGGIDANGALNQLWMYDPAVALWQQKAALPGNTRSASASFTLNGLGYVCGGLLQGGTATDQLWAYDPVTNVWVARSPMPGTARHRTVAFTVNDKAYVVGGADAQFNALSDGWCYDPFTNAWTVIAPLPQARFSSDAVSVIDGGVVIGGASDLGTAHDDVWVYRPALDAWEALPDFAGGPRRGGCAAGWGGVRVYYGTGSDNTQRYNDWQLLDVPVGLAEHADGPRLAIHPDPVADLVRIILPPGWTKATLLVVDAQGRVIRQWADIHTASHDIPFLAPGRYVLVAENKGERLAAPFVKLP